MLEPFVKHSLDQAFKKQGLGSVSFTLDDYNDLEELNSIAKQMKRSDSVIAGFPVDVGEVRLYPMTIAKHRFFIDNNLDDDGLVYLMSIPNSEEIPTVSEIKKGAGKFIRKIKVTELELAECLDKALNTGREDDETAERIIKWHQDRLLNKDITKAEFCKAMDALADNILASSKDETGGTDYPQIIDLMCREYGNTPSYWLNECPMAIINQTIDKINTRLSGETENGTPIYIVKLLSRYRNTQTEILKRWQTK